LRQSNFTSIVSNVNKQFGLELLVSKEAYKLFHDHIRFVAGRFWDKLEAVDRKTVLNRPTDLTVHVKSIKTHPIEQLFAKLKAMLRSAAARTKDALWGTIGQVLEAFSEAECRNYLAHCGYELTLIEPALEIELDRAEHAVRQLPCATTGERIVPVGRILYSNL
jgi:hypothetical protein